MLQLDLVYSLNFCLIRGIVLNWKINNNNVPVCHSAPATPHLLWNTRGSTNSLRCSSRPGCRDAAYACKTPLTMETACWTPRSIAPTLLKAGFTGRASEMALLLMRIICIYIGTDWRLISSNMLRQIDFFWFF